MTREPLNKKHSNKRIHISKLRMANYTAENVSFPPYFTPNSEYYPQKGRLIPWSGKNLFEHASPSADLHTQTVHSICLNSWLILCTALF